MTILGPLDRSLLITPMKFSDNFRRTAKKLEINCKKTFEKLHGNIRILEQYLRNNGGIFAEKVLKYYRKIF